MMLEKNFLGREGFIWFLGIVENNIDPLKSNMVQARAFGYHTDDKAVLPTKNLPWAQCMMPNTSPSVSEIGENVDVLNGSFVFGFFLDGNEAQHPMILGTFASIPMELPVPTKGFNDPDGVYPAYTDEPDTTKLARGESTDQTIVQSKIDNLDKGVVDSEGNTFDEPDNPYAAVYPKNHVKRSEAGHVHEVDDTEGAERIHRYHKSGSFDEMHPNGDVVKKTVGDDYKIVENTSYEHVKKKVVTIDEDCLVQVTAGNVVINVAAGDVKLTVVGNVDADVTGDVDAHVTGTMDAKVDTKVLITSPFIDVGTDGNEPMVLGDKLAAFIASELKAQYDSHVHIGNLGVSTSPPTVPFDTGTATKGDAVYSKKNTNQ